MSATNRSKLINKLFKVAKKHYSPIPVVSSRTVLEHMLFACCLENSMDESADEAFAKLEEQFFDWNEVRVTTAAELKESMKRLSDPDAASVLLKKTLHGVFETYYKFDIDFLKKENLRKTVQQFSKFRGVSPFVVSYAAQVALGGHYIPLDDAMLNLMVVVGIISEDEAAKGKVPGLERTISKNKGIEFSSVVHQLAAAFHKTPFGKDVRAIILSIDADAKDRFPKRGGRKKAEPAKPAKTTEAASKTAKSTKAATSKESKSTAAKKTTAKKKAAKKAVSKPAKKTATRKKVTKNAPARKKKTTTKKKTKKTAARKSTKKKSSTRSLSKRKPR